MPADIATTKDTLEIFEHLKSLILANAKHVHGASKNGRPRTYDVITASKVRSHGEFRVSLIGYEETPKPAGKTDIDGKVLNKSAVKQTLNLAMEDLLRKLQEELWS